MSILVIAEHDNSENKSATLVTIAAAQAIGGDIDVLVAGSGVDAVTVRVRVFAMAAPRQHSCGIFQLALF